MCSWQNITQSTESPSPAKKNTVVMPALTRESVQFEGRSLSLVCFALNLTVYQRHVIKRGHKTLRTVPNAPGKSCGTGESFPHSHSVVVVAGSGCCLALGNQQSVLYVLPNPLLLLFPISVFCYSGACDTHSLIYGYFAYRIYIPANNIIRRGKEWKGTLKRYTDLNFRIL